MAVAVDPERGRRKTRADDSRNAGFALPVFVDRLFVSFVGLLLGCGAAGISRILGAPGRTASLTVWPGQGPPGRTRA